MVVALSATATATATATQKPKTTRTVLIAKAKRKVTNIKVRQYWIGLMKVPHVIRHLYRPPRLHRRLLIRRGKGR